ncbi:MAG: hypothetical protein PVJ04_17665, partial [Gemmatimonadota bacterium]
MIQRRILSLVILGSALVSGCARRIPETEPADLPRLQAAVQANPYDPELLTYLGMAQYRARQVREAEATLEDESDWAGARAAYLSYLERGEYGPLKQEIEGRLAYIIRQGFRAQAEDVVAQEEELSGQAPTPGSVAVLPFQLITEDEELTPLQVALADMMTTDLTLAGGLTVLERA